MDARAFSRDAPLTSKDLAILFFHPTSPWELPKQGWTLGVVPVMCAVPELQSNQDEKLVATFLKSQ